MSQISRRRRSGAGRLIGVRICDSFVQRVGRLSPQIRPNDCRDHAPNDQDDGHGHVRTNVIPIVENFGVEHRAEDAEHLGCGIQETGGCAFGFGIG